MILRNSRLRFRGSKLENRTSTYGTNKMQELFNEPV